MLQDYFRIEDTDKVSGVYFTIPQEDKQWSSKYADVDLGKELYNIRRNKEYYKEEYPEDYNKQLLDLGLFEPNMRGASSMRNLELFQETVPRDVTMINIWQCESEYQRGDSIR